MEIQQTSRTCHLAITTPKLTVYRPTIMSQSNESQPGHQAWGIEEDEEELAAAREHVSIPRRLLQLQPPPSWPTFCGPRH